MNIADINQEARDLVDADSTSLTDATLLRRVNSSLETLVGKIINADGTWEYDDTNYSNLPVGTGTLVDTQESYSFAAEYLEILRIKVLDAGGNLKKLIPIDEIELPRSISIEEYFADTGLPTHYAILGDSIRLYPAPATADVTLTNGLKIEFTRTADLFTSAQVTTGTKEPGLPSPYHVLLSYMMALPYAISYKKDRVALFKREIDDMTKDMIKFYGHREKDRKKKMTMRRINFR